MPGQAIDLAPPQGEPKNHDRRNRITATLATAAVALTAFTGAAGAAGQADTKVSIKGDNGDYYGYDLTLSGKIT